MTQKQYEAAETIMQLSRIFADGMRECMKNSGLMDAGYELQVNVFQPFECVDAVLMTSVSMDPKGMTSTEEYRAKAFCNHHYEKEGWVVINDPALKPGTVPPTVRTAETASAVYRAGKAPEKATPPDGLWLSRYDDYCPVDGGM